MEHFDKLFIAKDPKEVSPEYLNSLIMVGSSNWDYYLETPGNFETETLYNIDLIEFEAEEKMFKFVQDEKQRVVDYSIDHEKPCVLVYGN